MGHHPVPQRPHRRTGKILRLYTSVSHVDGIFYFPNGGMIWYLPLRCIRLNRYSRPS